MIPSVYNVCVCVFGDFNCFDVFHIYMFVLRVCHVFCVVFSCFFVLGCCVVSNVCGLFFHAVVVAVSNIIRICIYELMLCCL